MNELTKEMQPMTWQLEGPFQVSDGEIKVKPVSLAEGFSSTTLKYTSTN